MDQFAAPVDWDALEREAWLMSENAALKRRVAELEEVQNKWPDNQRLLEVGGAATLEGQWRGAPRARP